MNQPTASVHTVGMSCGLPVDNQRVIPCHQRTRVQDVRGRAFPVSTATLVYAGLHGCHPQSTALITVINVYTSDTHNRYYRSTRTFT